jgi:hypothetical protein
MNKGARKNENFKKPNKKHLDNVDFMLKYCFLESRTTIRYSTHCQMTVPKYLVVGISFKSE